MKKSKSIEEIAKAFSKAQAEMGGAVNNEANTFFKNKYADLSSIIRVIKPAFANNGLSYSQFPITEDTRIGVETIIFHSSGQFISNEFTMNVPKADPQSAGGVLTYCRRYALQAVVGVPAVDRDAEDFMQVVREEEEYEKVKEEAEADMEKVLSKDKPVTQKSKWKKTPKSLGELGARYLEDMSLDELEKLAGKASSEYWQDAIKAQKSICVGEVQKANLSWETKK